MKFKNLREYLKCYLTSDITLLADNFNQFRKIVFDQFELDPVKYISSFINKRLWIKIFKM